MIPTARCRSCDRAGPADHCGALNNAHERIQPGDHYDLSAARPAPLR